MTTPTCTSCGQPSPCAHVRAVVAQSCGERCTVPDEQFEAMVEAFMTAEVKSYRTSAAKLRYLEPDRDEAERMAAVALAALPAVPVHLTAPKEDESLRWIAGEVTVDVGWEDHEPYVLLRDENAVCYVNDDHHDVGNLMAALRAAHAITKPKPLPEDFLAGWLDEQIAEHERKAPRGSTEMARAHEMTVSALREVRDRLTRPVSPGGDGADDGGREQ